MRFISAAIGLLIGFLEIEDASAVNLMETSKNMTQSQQNGKKMTSIRLTQIENNNTRFDEFIKPLSSASNLALAQAMKIPTIKGKDGHIRLLQANQTTTLTD